MIKLKRVYDAPSETDGIRILVERLWPRGMTKEAAKIDIWLKEIAPSPELRSWYKHDPERWAEFQRRYTDELMDNNLIEELKHKVENNKVTFIFAAKDVDRNSAKVLKEFLEQES